MATTQQVSGGLIDQINAHLNSATPEELVFLAKALQLTVVPSSVQELIDLVTAEKDSGVMALTDLSTNLTASMNAIADSRKADLEQTGLSVDEIASMIYEQDIGFV